MEKAKIIQRAKSYMDMLVGGIDPISGESVSEDSVVNQERLKNCFAYISDILGELLNNGYVSISDSADGADAPAGFVRQKSAFSINEYQKSNVTITDSPIAPMSFVKNINAVIDQKNMEKLSVTSINKWLVKCGYLAETKMPTVVNKTVKTVTPASGMIGIIEQQVVDKTTGELKPQLLFTKQAQEYILDNLESALG